MHLRREDITRLSAKVFKNLKEHSLLTFRAPENEVAAKIEEIISGHFQEEAAIEEEVKKLMEQYRSQIASGSVDPQKAYMMIKKQVAKERKFVL